MGWQDDPVVAQPGKSPWEMDPVVGQQDPGFAANAVRALTAPEAAPNNGTLAGVSRALEVNLPFVDRAVAGAQSVLPQGYGGTGQDYATNLSAERQKNAQFASNNPWTTAVGGLTAYAPAALIGGGATLPARIGAQGLTGLGLGAVQGASNSPDLTNPQATGQSIAQGGLTGGALGAAVPAVAHGIGSVVNPLAAGLMRGPGKADVAALGNDVSSAYQGAKDLGAAYKPEAIQRLTDKIAADAKEADIDPGLNSKATAIISNLQQRADAAMESGTPVTLGQLDKARQFVSDNLAGLPEPKQARFGSLIKSNIDEFISGAKPEDMAGGTGPAAADAIGNARDLAMRQYKAQALSGALDKAELNAAKSGSGGNIENATRQRLAAIMDEEPWSQDERAQLNKMVRGGPVSNTFREVSKLSPFGHAVPLMADLVGPALGHVAIPGVSSAIGAAAQAGGALMRRGDRNKLLAMILAGGAAPEQTSSNAPTRAALAAALAGNANLQAQRNQSLP